MKKWRILILGASGFVGDACARIFGELGHDVTGVGRRAAPELGNRIFHTGELDAAHLRELVAECSPDLCLNAAGSGSPAASMNAPGADFEANTALVQRTLEALRLEAPRCRYIGISSAAVYANNPNFPWTEDAWPAPCSPYGYHKRCAEMLAEEYHRLFGLPTLTLRAFSIYGPRLRKQLFWDIFQRARCTDEVMLFGTGRETRDYLYIDDMVAGVLQLAGQARFVGEVLNLASGQVTTIDDACGRLLSELGWQGKHRFTGVEIPGSPARMEADMTRAFALGFRPRIDLAEGLQRTAAWLKATHDAP